MTSTSVFPRARKTLLLTVVAVIFDIAAIYAGFVIAYLYPLGSPEPAPLAAVTTFLVAAALAIPVWVLVLGACGLYSTRRRYGRLSQIARATVAVTLSVTTLIVLDYFWLGFTLFPRRTTPLVALSLGLLAMLVGRQLLSWLIGQFHRHGRGLTNVIVVGTGPVADRLAMELKASQGSNVVAAVSTTGDGGIFGDDRPVYATIEQALNSHRIRIDEIIQTDPTLGRAESAKLMTLANDRHLGYRFVPDLFGVFAASSTMSTIAGVPVMEVRLTSLDGWATAGKRIVDVLGAALGLIVLAPLFLAIALLVKISDPDGPVLYRQERLGRGGRTIGVYKFRSMRWAYSTGPMRPFQTAEQAFLAMGRADLVAEFARSQKVDSDPRVSRLGVFLRRSSLDELPQLFNALLGDLSLVGPRPITPAELDRYGPHQHSFLALKPGITGLWQVSGRSELGYDQRVKLDVYYAENWSLPLDLTILAKTVKTVAARRGAY